MWLFLSFTWKQFFRPLKAKLLENSFQGCFTLTGNRVLWLVPCVWWLDRARFHRSNMTLYMCLDIQLSHYIEGQKRQIFSHFFLHFLNVYSSMTLKSNSASLSVHTWLPLAPRPCCWWTFSSLVWHHLTASLCVWMWTRLFQNNTDVYGDFLLTRETKDSCSLDYYAVSSLSPLLK